MKLKDAIASLSQEHPEDTLIPLYTPWGDQIRNEKAPSIWPEYPRPQLRRTDFHILNGKWRYAFTTSAVQPGHRLIADGEILVPFSPECLLSGVNRQLQPGEYLWYERKLSFPKEELGKKAGGFRCILHFGAVDQHAAVYANGNEVVSHSGGYLPFWADLTEHVSEESILLQVCVRDDSDTSYYTRGKQTLKRGGMFYTAQSGIWQSVWYEWVPENYITAIRITPDLDNRQVTVELSSPGKFSNITCTVQEATTHFSIDETVEKDSTDDHFHEAAAKNSADSHLHKAIPKDSANAHFHEAVTKAPADDHFHKVPRQLAEVSVTVESPSTTTLRLTLPEDGFHPWTTEEPWLYAFTIEADDDVVQSYFAMRSFTIEKDERGIPRFCLNHKPCFLHGLLDQGYWSDGLMTAPCDEAFLFDINLARENGFNMLRKHIKIEPLRWYYHCDRLGMIVWQDMVSGGTTYHMPLVCYMPTLFPHMGAHTKDHHYRLFSRADKEGRASWEQECLDTMRHLHNVPSIAVWVPFNEGWGQFDAARIAQMVKEKDPSRPVDHASGWFDQKGGDFRSIHNYFRPLKVKLDGRRAFVISEYGGFACFIPGHSSVERIYGYRKYADTQELTDAYLELTEKNLFPLFEAGLSGAVYTQLSDIEEEVNGLVTYDRRVVKLIRS